VCAALRRPATATAVATPPRVAVEVRISEQHAMATWRSMHGDGRCPAGTSMGSYLAASRLPCPGSPPGQTFQVGIPGFYSSSQTLTSATVENAEQFATHIPPDQASPEIIADASSIIGQR
jgi:hypothetical protein